MERSSGNRGPGQDVICTEDWASVLLVILSGFDHTEDSTENSIWASGQEEQGWTWWVRWSSGPQRLAATGGRDSLEFWGRLLPNLLLHWLYSLLHIHDEL